MYDDELAERVRGTLATQPDVTEKKMFGGLAFLLSGRMAVAASGNGGLMVRTRPHETEQLLTRPGVAVIEMRGRSMKHWLRVDPDLLDSDEALGEWIDIGVAAARAQPSRG